MKIWTPHPYQQEAVNDILRNTHRTLWFFPGDGKTSMSLEAFRQLKEKGIVRKCLIVAPKSVAEDTWPNEIKKWANFSHFTYTILMGNKKNELVKNDSDIYIINFESLKWMLSAKYTGKSKYKSTQQISVNSGYLHQIGVDMLIVDELSKCKSPSAMQARLVHKIAPFFKKRIGLTATPASNSLLDVFQETKCMDLGETFGSGFTKYRSTYFEPVPETRIWKLRNGAADTIYAKLAPLVTQRQQRSLDGLPTLTITEMPIELPADVRAFYTKLEKKFVADFDNKEIDAFNAGVKTLRLRQIASGGMYYTSPEEKERARKEFMENLRLPSGPASRETILLHYAKSQALANLVDGLNGQPLLVFYSFNHDIDNIKSILGDVPVLGNTPDRSALMRKWNDGKLPILLLHAKSAAHGLNLQESGGHICWYTLEWSHDIHEQAIGRVWRQGNPAPETRVYYLLAKNTVDEHVLSTVRSKGVTQQELFDGVKKYYLSLKEKHLENSYMS